MTRRIAAEASGLLCSVSPDFDTVPSGFADLIDLLWAATELGKAREMAGAMVAVLAALADRVLSFSEKLSPQQLATAERGFFLKKTKISRSMPR